MLAAKVYRPLESRRFKNDAVYQTGRMHLARNGRVKRAADSGSAFGRKVQAGTWLDNEWQIMLRLFEAGLAVPQPLARAERAILMPFLGNAQHGPAPKLIDASLESHEVERMARRLLEQIERMLDLDIVHGDLSPYNVLCWRGEPVIIDFPQAIDPRLNPAAQTLLERDIENICQWAVRRGCRTRFDAAAVAHDLWRRFVLGEIG